MQLNKYTTYTHIDFNTEYLDPKSLKTLELKKHYESQGYTVTVERGVHGYYLRVQKLT